ncbi:MAG TPA: hypothetical protein VNH46_03615, partial [Gemmatimonadales bacterium]|nr:hypothetical protein [Gemmatimonadales bacterium]
MRRAPASELFAWSLVGLGLGLVAGFALGEWLGPVDRDRVRRSVTRLRQREDQTPAPLRPFEAVRAARRALEEDSLLRGLRIDARA